MTGLKNRIDGCNREKGTSIDKALNNVLVCIKNTKEDNEKIEKQFEAIGVRLKDEDGKFRSFTDIIDDISEKWEGLK